MGLCPDVEKQIVCESTVILHPPLSDGLSCSVAQLERHRVNVSEYLTFTHLTMSPSYLNSISLKAVHAHIAKLVNALSEL